MKIRRDLAEQAIARLAGRLGLGVPQTAQGILSVVTANMARAIRVISVQRGHDPRDYTLMAFGGAGPLHAARLARELEIGRVLVPANPGILCAMGLLLTDLRADFAATRLMPATEASTADVAEGFAALAERAERWFEHEGIASADRHITRTVDMRYHGQNYELSVAVPDGPISKATLQALAAGFADVHRQRYGFAADGDPVQIVTLRVEATGAVRKAELRAHPEAGPDASGAIAQRRPVWLAEAGDVVDTPIYARDALRPGNRFAGPAIVEQMDATTLVPPGWTRGSMRISTSSSRRDMSSDLPPQRVGRCRAAGGGVRARFVAHDPSVAVDGDTSLASRGRNDQARPHHRRSHRRGHGLDRRGDRRDADPRLAFDQHQGAARLLDGAVQRRRRDAVPGRAHPHPSRQLPRPHQAHHAALPDAGHPAGRRLHRQRRLRGRRHASARHRRRRADLHRRPHGRLDGEPRPPCRLRRSRPRPHLPGGPAHPAGAALSRRRAAAATCRT